MVMQGALSSRLQSSVVGILLMLLGTLALAAEPAITAAPPVVASGVVTTEAKPEIWPDWKMIRRLAKAVTQARDSGVKSITEWNNQSRKCGVPVGTFAQLELNYSKPGCREILDAIRDPGQFRLFWRRCENFGNTYNELAENFSRADDSQFVDRDMVRNELTKIYGILKEFCSTSYGDTGVYPSMISLIREYESLFSNNSYIGSEEILDFRAALGVHN